MSVIGIDFGNENCFIAVARAGGIETIANEYSQRDTPSYVAFGSKQRDFGISAKNKQNTNVKSTIYGFKRLVGRRFDDPDVARERQLLPYQLIETPDGEVGVLVNYLDREDKFSTRQITAMMFTKLKEIAENALKIKVTDCVISVPLFFNDAERRAMLDAARIAGLNCLKLMNETTAVALSYGFYKANLPEDKPRLVAFVDVGHSALQVSIVAFNKDRLRMLACETDVIGGRDFDRILVEYFCDDFASRYKLDVRSNKRAVIRLYTECEKLKKQMSSIALELPINIECFMEDKDVTGKLKRDALEELATPLLKRIEAVMARAIANCPEIDEDTPVTAQDIDSVEIVGGSSRVPAVKAIVKSVFGREPSTTLNADEAVARGCALQCAMLSPTFKVRDFNLIDLQPYPIVVRCLPIQNAVEPTDYDVFPRFYQVPFSRVISITRREPFQLEAFYHESVPFPHKQIASYLINVKPTNAEAAPEDKVKVKVRLNPNGVFNVVSATLYERQQEPEPTQDSQDSAAGDAEAPKGTEGNAATGPTSPPVNTSQQDDVMETDQTKETKKKGPKPKQTDIAVETQAAFNCQEVQALTALEASMVKADKTEKERLDAKNAVEEYVYEMRDKLSEVLSQFVSDQDRQVLATKLEDTENWLYGDGEELEKKEYTDRLEELHSLGEPIQERYREFHERPRALEYCGALLQRVRRVVTAYRNGDEQYNHLPAEDMDRLSAQLDTKQEWFDLTIGKLNNSSPHLPPPIFVSQIHEEATSFERTANQIIQKPKPAPPAPPKEDKEEAMNAEDAATKDSPKDGKDSAPTETKDTPNGMENMEVD